MTRLPRCHTRNANHQLPAFLTPTTNQDDATVDDEDVSNTPEVADDA